MSLLELYRPDNVDRQKIESFRETYIKRPLKNADTKDNLDITYNEIFKRLKGTGTLWEDPYFKADSTSLFIPNKTYEWLRPKEIDEDASLTFKGPSRFDVKQLVTTYLDRGHFLSALASFANYKTLFNNVVPEGQDFEKNYIGAFRYRFWIFGKWREIIVDDRLPTENGTLVFVYSKRDFEFWTPLAEKAYAKMYGTYGVIRKLNKPEAMQDLTGGICERFSLNAKKRPNDLFAQMLMFDALSSLMCCDMEEAGEEIYEVDGLNSLHSHSITAVVKMKLTDGKTANLIRICNPWGSDTEWTEKWSDNSKIWNTVSAEDKKKYNRKKDDGEFWMTYEDFVDNFKNLVVCHLGPESTSNGIDDKIRWDMHMHTGAWMKNVNAGGTRKTFDSYVTNPQFVVEILSPDKGDKNNNVTLIVCLTQLDMRSLNIDLYAIGYDIYPLQNPNSGFHRKSFFKNTKPISETTYYGIKRDISSRHILPTGYYLIVPSTYFPKQEGKFILRLGSQKITSSKENDNRIGPVDPDIEPVIPDQPVIPVVPVIPDKPVIPVEPVIPDKPVIPVEPVIPDKPVIPVEPVIPDKPVIPVEPVIPDKPVIPVEPVIPDKPVIPVEPVIPDKPDKYPDATTFDGADKEFEKIFDFICFPDNTIDAALLQTILNKLLKKDPLFIKIKNSEEFSLDDCRSIIGYYDINKNAKMELKEFISFFRSLKLWKFVYFHYDEDNNGFFNSTEYRDACLHCGFRLSNHLLTVLVLKYADPKTGHITFVDLVVSLILLLKSYSELERQANSGKGWIPYACVEYLNSL